jgi:hypothetical protein
MDEIKAISDFGLRLADLNRAARVPSDAVDSPSNSVDRSDEKKQQIAKDFESVLMTKLFDEVQQSMGNWDAEEEDGQSQQVQGLFWLYLARDTADKGGFGLWKDIYQHLQQMDGIPNAAASIDEEL